MAEFVVEFEAIDNAFDTEFEGFTPVSDGGFERGYQYGYADALSKRTDLVVTENGEYAPSEGSTGFKSVSVQVPNKLSQVVDKTVTEITEDDLRGATKIANNVFSNCRQLASVAIPEGVTEITGRPFDGCSSLKTLVIPKSLESVSNYPFYGCSTDVYIKDLLSWLNLTTSGDYTNPSGYKYFWGSNGNDMTTIVIPEGVTTIRNSAFSKCKNLTSIEIPNSVLSIDRGAFSNCTALTSANIPAGITIIPSSLFQGCTLLSNITIPEGVTSIGEYAFYNCKALTTLTIPACVSIIGSYAFGSCNAIANLIVKAVTPPTLKSNTALNDGPKKITVPRGTKEAYDSATNWSTYANKIVEGDV